MLRLFGSEIDPFGGRRPVVTIGMFDGVHVGHKRVLRETCSWARETAAPCMAITFDVHPAAIVTPERKLPMITSLEHRLVLLEKVGLGACLVLHFDRLLAGLPAIDFVKDILAGKLHVHGVVLGWDAAFGKGRKGNLEFLQRIAADFDFEVRGVGPVKINNEIVSSTAVRNAVMSGQLPLAESMLGRPVSVLGTVVAGNGLGRKLGFPTLNLDPHHELRPPRGVYITRTRCGHTVWPSITNVGHRPTVDAGHDNEVLVESHLLENGCNLYGQVVEVEFLAHIRDELRFTDIETMRNRLAIDVSHAWQYFQKNPLHDV